MDSEENNRLSDDPSEHPKGADTPAEKPKIDPTQKPGEISEDMQEKAGELLWSDDGGSGIVDSGLSLQEEWECDPAFIASLSQVGWNIEMWLEPAALRLADAMMILDITPHIFDKAKRQGLIKEGKVELLGYIAMPSVYRAFCKIRDKDPQWMKLLKEDKTIPVVWELPDDEEDKNKEFKLIAEDDTAQDKEEFELLGSAGDQEMWELGDNEDSKSAVGKTEEFLLSPDDEMFMDTETPIDSKEKAETYERETAPRAEAHERGDASRAEAAPRSTERAERTARPTTDSPKDSAWRSWAADLTKKYRKGREKGEIIKTIDGGARTLGGGIAGYTGGQALAWTFGSGLRAAAVTGGGLFSNILAPVGFPLAAPIVTLAGRRAVAKFAHEGSVDKKYTETLLKVAGRIPDSGKPAAGLTTEVEVIETLDKHKDKIERSATSKSLIDTMEEVELMEIMAKYAQCSPAEVPYLGSDSRYARYIFTQFTEVTEKLFKDPNFAPNEKNKKAVVSLFHIEEGHDKESPTPEKKMKVLEKLWEVSHEYGRLIAYEHRKNRNKQLNGQLIGGAVVSAPLLGIVPPLLAGGAAYLARRYYTEFNKPKDIEFDTNGHLLVSPSSLEDSDGTYALYRDTVFNTELPAPTDEHTYWMNHMKFDKTKFHEKKVKNANILAFYHQQYLMKELTGKKLPPPIVKEEEKQKSESDFRSEDAALKELKTDLRRCESDLRKAQSEQKKYKGMLSKLDRNNPRHDTKVLDVEGEIEECESRIAELKLEAREIKEKIDGSDGQEARAKKAKDKWEALLNPAKTSLTLSDDPKKIFDINAYEKSGDEKNAEKEVEAKEKRLASMRKTFDEKKYTLEGEKIDPDSYGVVEDLKIATNEAAYAFEDSKSEEVPAGDPDLKSAWEKLKKEHDETSRLVLMIKEVETAKENVQKLENAKKEKLEHSFKIIREAFAMQMKQEWDNRLAGKKPSLAKNASGAALNGAKVSAQFLATQALTLAVKAAVPAGTVIATYAGLHMAGAGGLINAISTVIPPGLVVTTAAVIGVVAHLKKSLGSAGLQAIASLWKKKAETAEKKTETETPA